MPNPLLSRTLAALSTLLIVCACLLCPAPAHAGSPNLSPAAANARREVVNLFSDEMQQAAMKLKWHGERLTEDTVYAVALTGLSWELAWGNDHLFSLAWGDLRKVPTLGKRGNKSYAALVAEVQRDYADHNYQQAVNVAGENFSLDEIGCDVNLKEPVGYSLLELGQPERAFPIFSAPFDPSHALINVAEANRKFREAALDAARRAGLTREAIAFAVSLLLEPGQDTPNVHAGALGYLEQVGVDVDRILLGILQAPEHLHNLPAYQYVAADLMAYRASPRLLPFLLHLADSDDVYLRSRAVIGLGILAYKPRPGDPPDWGGKAVLIALREYGLSSGERKLIDREIAQAADSDKYRLRSAAALALALTGEEENVPLLQKLAKDRAYVLSTPEGDAANGGRVHHLLFPVRMAAAVGLARFGIQMEAVGGDYVGKALDVARRGGEDVTNDRRSLRREVAGQIYVSPLDVATAAPLASAHR